MCARLSAHGGVAVRCAHSLASLLFPRAADNNERLPLALSLSRSRARSLSFSLSLALTHARAPSLSLARALSRSPCLADVFHIFFILFGCQRHGRRRRRRAEAQARQRARGADDKGPARTREHRHQPQTQASEATAHWCRDSLDVTKFARTPVATFEKPVDFVQPLPLTGAAQLIQVCGFGSLSHSCPLSHLVASPWPRAFLPLSILVLCFP
jgi:hypothetical protein